MQTVVDILRRTAQEQLKQLEDPYRAWNTLARVLTAADATQEGVMFQLEMCLKSPSISPERKQVYRHGLAVLTNTCYYCGCGNPEGMEAATGRPQCIECAVTDYGKRLVLSSVE